MRAFVLPLAAAGLWFGPPPACAADPSKFDLAQVERTIAKEPSYKSKAPRYCLLVFGAEAKFRVWLVQDGDVLYVDRNGNGDLTESGERVEKKDGAAGQRHFVVGSLTDGELKHTIEYVMEMAVTEASVGAPKEFARIKGKHDQAINTWIGISAERSAGDDRSLPKHIKYVVNGDGKGYLSFADRPQDAPVAHLNGPWTLGLQDIKQRLAVGQKTNLQLGVGTPGVGPGTFAFVRYPNTIPNDAYPKGEFTFPRKSSGDEALVATVVFKKRC
jgi:hypothetical protein